MKALKIIGIIVVAIVLIVLVLGFLAPKEMHVERDIVIDAPMSVVKDQTIHFSKFKEWQPWAELDPAMESSIEGEDGTVGAVYTWKGNDDVGEGSQEITSITDSRADIKLTFTAPWESESNTYFEYEPVNEGVKVTWGMDGDLGFMESIMMNYLMDGEKMVGDMYEKGLAKLKEVSEAVSTSAYQINTITIPERTYIGVRDEISWDEMEAFYGTNLDVAFQAVQGAGLEMDGAPSGIYYTWNEEERTTDMVAAIPVKGAASLDNFEVTPVSGKALHVAYYGPYEGSGAAHYALDDYLKANNIESEMAIEEYVTDPTTEPDTSKWLTNIYYVLK